MSVLVFREALSRAERDAYRQHVEEVLRRADGLDAEMLTQVRGLVMEAQDRLLARLVRVLGGQGTDWDAFITPHILRAVEDVASHLSQRFKVAIETILPRVHEVGVDLVDTAIGGAGVKIGALPVVAPETVKIASMLKPGLISNVGDEMRTRVQHQIQQAFLVGDSPHTVMQNIAASGIDKGPWQSVAYRGEIIARTEIANVQGMAAQKRMEHVVAQHPEIGMRKRWLVAHIKEWPCEQCAPLEGQDWDVNDPDAPSVPRHPNCFPGSTRVSICGVLQAVYRRHYAGEMVQVWTLDYDTEVFTVTPNHPVLTSRGWVPAGEVEEGDDLVRGAFAEWMGADHHVDDPELSLEEIFEAASNAGFVERVAGSTMDFHGDGNLEEVQIVRVDRQLLNEVVASPHQHPVHRSLSVTDCAVPFQSCLGCLFVRSLGMCAAQQGISPVAVKTLPTQEVGFGTRAWCEAGSSDERSDSTALDPELVRQRDLRYPLGVQADDLPRIVRMLTEAGESRGSALSSKLDSSFLQCPDDDRLTGSDDPTDRPDAVPFFIEMARVVGVKRTWFAGHVYNLQTSSGFYTTGKIPVRNCRCAIVPYFPGLSSDLEVPAEKQAAASVAEVEEAYNPSQSRDAHGRFGSGGR